MDDSIRMNLSAVVISIVGVISSVFTCFMNIFLLIKTTKKKQGMQLFYYRFALDVILGAFVAAFLTFVVLFSFFSEELVNYQNFIFYFSLPASNIGAMRSIVTLSVSIERVIAAFAPIFFHNYHQLFPTSMLLVIAVLFGLTEDIVLYGLCQFHLAIPKNCVAFGCSINTCFFNYWTAHKTTIFALTFLFSIILCIKLFIWNKFGKKNEIELSRVNLLSLIDAATVFLFDFLPSFVANQLSTTHFFSFQNIGPYGAVAKLFGCAIEAILVFKTLTRKREPNTTENSKSERNNWKKRKSQVNWK